MSEENNIEVVKEQQPKMTAEERDAKLIEWGYYNKEYSPDDSKSEEYPFEEYIGPTQTFYKKVPYDLSDEEFEKLVTDITKRDKEEANNKIKIKGLNDSNKIATIFQVLGYVMFLAAFILGFVLGRDTSGWRDKLSFPLMLAYWGGGFVTGMFMLAIAEVITLLETIKNKIK